MRKDAGYGHIIAVAKQIGAPKWGVVPEAKLRDSLVAARRAAGHILPQAHRLKPNVIGERRQGLNQIRVMDCWVERVRRIEHAPSAQWKQPETSLGCSIMWPLSIRVEPIASRRHAATACADDRPRTLFSRSNQSSKQLRWIDPIVIASDDRGTREIAERTQKLFIGSQISLDEANFEAVLGELRQPCKALR